MYAIYLTRRIRSMKEAKEVAEFLALEEGPASDDESGSASDDHAEAEPEVDVDALDGDGEIDRSYDISMKCEFKGEEDSDGDPTETGPASSFLCRCCKRKLPPVAVRSASPGEDTVWIGCDVGGGFYHADCVPFVKAAVADGFDLDEIDFTCWKCETRARLAEAAAALEAEYDAQRAERMEVRVFAGSDTADGVWTAVEKEFWQQEPQVLRRIFETKVMMMKMIIRHEGRNNFNLPHFRSGGAAT
jgi:hypothetical protein